MNQLVFIENNRVLTDSLTISTVFKKEHRNVIRDIETQLEKLKEAGEGNWGVLNFERAQYQHPQNKQFYTKYLLTEEAFTLVAMSYVTPEAMKFKVRFIEEFKKMKNKLQVLNKPSYMIEDPIKRAEKWIEEQKEKQTIQKQLEQQKPLVNFAETCMASDKSLLVREVAKMISKQGILMGERRLFQKLRDWKLIFPNKNEPYQEYIDRGYFEISQGVKETSKGSFTWLTMRVTPKGQMYIINRLKKEQQKEAI